MKSTITLIIGDVDVSEFVERENYSVKKVWKGENAFTDINGKDVKLSWNYQLKASFENVPEELMQEITSALDNDVIPITFTDPHSENMLTTDNFQRGESTGGSVSAELDDGLRWNFSVNLMSENHLGGGL